jgi:hypothetical protein
MTDALDRGHALFRALTGTMDRTHGRQVLAALHRVPGPLLHELQTALANSPCSSDRALQCVARLHALVPDLLWAPHGLWTERRERMTAWAPAIDDRPAVAGTALSGAGVSTAGRQASQAFGALQVLRTVAALWAVPVAPFPVQARAQAEATLRLVCKGAAAALHPATVLVGHGVPRHLHGAFLHRDAHGVAPWVRLALFGGAWVRPAKPGTLTAAQLVQQQEVWLVVQWGTSRCLLSMRGGVTHAVLSMTRCEPRPCPPYPPKQAALRVVDGSADCTLVGFPHPLKVIAWAVTTDGEPSEHAWGRAHGPRGAAAAAPR